MNDQRSFKVPFFLILLLQFLLLFAKFRSSSSAFTWPTKKQPTKFGSSVIFPVTGNVYPTGYYHVTINVGQPPKPYFLDIDTGSDLTWLQCDAPCAKCTPAPHGPYRPSRNLVACKDPLCASLHSPGNHPCETPEEQCDYEVEYADSGSSLGVLVKDLFPLKFTNGSNISPRLAFGCGYNQEFPASTNPPYTDGVLGLGTGKSSIVAQLRDLGLVQNVLGHCLSGQGGGFLFFGHDVVPSSGVTWTAMLPTSSEKHYIAGPADLIFPDQATGIKGLPIVFDSGSTYSYLSSQAYSPLVALIKKNIDTKQLKEAKDDKSLPLCWKGSRPFRSIHDIKNQFKPLLLNFKNDRNVQFQLPPEAYLVITKLGNVCLGILNGSEVGLGNFNIIGDISVQDKMVIYDNEKQLIGWAPANCNRLPNIVRDRQADFCQPYAVNIGIFAEICPSVHES